ncbi:MAG: RusA family crossover junction endodeoxyribonuclease [Chloroflexi bacterium]|nr:RusA family crossover junction endodeoxyribonuclease [Chloroflexota bacterium]
MAEQPSEYGNEQRYGKERLNEELDQVCKSFYDSYLKLTGFALSAKTNILEPETEDDLGELQTPASGDVHHAIYSARNPSCLYIYIPGPILGLNQCFKLARPQDRYYYGNIKRWWLAQIKAALVTLPFEARRVPFQPAAIIVSESARVDLDNIAIKSLLDALQNVGVIWRDDSTNCPVILMMKNKKQEEALEIVITDNQETIVALQNEAKKLLEQITTKRSGLHKIKKERNNIPPDTPFF